MGGGGGGGTVTPQASAPVNLPTLVAAVDIPLGTVVTAEMFRNETLAVTNRRADVFGDVSQAIGKTTRTALLTGQQVGAGDFQNRAIPLTVQPGERAFA